MSQTKFSQAKTNKKLSRHEIINNSVAITFERNMNMNNTPKRDIHHVK